jgi:hypothetical protein
MDEETRDRFAAAVERKKDEARARSHDPGPHNTPAGDVGGDQHSLISDSRKTQDAFSIRDKNSQKGKVTADKWNQ